MWDYVRGFFDAGDLTPHGFCLLWRSDILWTHVTSDAIIAISYFSIPAAIAYFVTKRDDIEFKPVLWAFALFIIACGATHVMSIVTLWKAYYGAEAAVKVVTAAVSVVTAAALWPLMPAALAWPSPKQLQSANDELRVLIRERDNAMVALQKEVVARTAMEQKLRHSQKMEAIGQLTGGVAHDFNNLMTIVLNNLERAGRVIDDKEKSTKAIQGALEGANRAAVLTRQLLTFARRQPMSPVRANINTALEGAASLSKNLLPDNVHMKLELGNALPEILVDVNEATNAIVNLIANARDAMPTGGTVTLSSRCVNIRDDNDVSAEYMEIRVTDEGTGMTQEVVEHAFEPFFTTKPVGKGSGLGLSQVYGFASQSGGYADIKSTPGEGASVSIFIPVKV
jgi:signal transduction histidine kinase